MTRPVRSRPASGHSRVQVVLGAGVLLLLAACGGPAAAGGRPALGPLPQIRSDADIVLPLDSYVGSRHDRAVRETARQELLARCMAGLGFAGYPVEDLRGYAQLPQHMNTFGTVSLTDAARDGFAPPAVRIMASSTFEERFGPWSGPDVEFARTGRSPDAPPAGAGVSPAPSTGQRATGSGAAGRQVPAGGCDAEATRQIAALARVAPVDSIWLDNQDSQLVTRAFEDPRMRPVTDAYAACMRAAGYAYATPAAAATDPRWSGDAEGGVRPGEAAVAEASVRCQQQVRYLDTWVALATAYEQQFVESNAERLQQYRTAHDAVLRAVGAAGLGRLGGTPGGPPPG